MIPQTDPGAGYRALKAEIDAAALRALGSGWYILGDEGRAFEAEFAAWLGSGQTVGCGNGTDAIALALRALDIGPGCTVATVSHTAVATVSAIEMTGAVPLLLDIEPDGFTLDAEELRAVLERPPAGLPPIRAAVVVHLYGQAADMSAILAACEAHGVTLIEDCAQAHGATWRGRKVGGIAQAASFSFYPTKNLGALGDGGATVAQDPAVVERLQALRQYGWRERFISAEAGVNSRLDELQAAILRVKLGHLDANNARRRAVADAYDAALAGSPFIAPVRRADCEHVFHQYVVRTPDRDVMQARLREAGVGTALHYPAPVHRQPAYEGRVALGPRGCSATDVARGEILSLPMFPEMTQEQVVRVCDAIRGL
ncbi:DegT/DnrJ/EryC1/StrS aminotransferase family protein [Phenylobacterium sp.]|uniref:DegT/DnrJ/EryC1/StrS family aminotransferase n=1 Tax=Phenylobacterium sp. TaxID=1871053 RepID=UPI002734B9CE|nr:DegT/DnrJ/EryC1/StrS family aminotransferase [Phenylobacterium sp.]MDP3659468.1 DegT/DnrJ/EryC1/StrS family aminotransferase [Phenylobacterium sp.]